MTLGIVTARMASTRLPGKVLADLAGRPLLAAIVERVRTAQTLDELVIATSTQPENDAIEELADRLGVRCFRGSEDDPLDRVHATAQTYGADVVVRLTGDNPFVDGAFVDEVVHAFLDSSPPADFASSTLSGTYPYGVSVEVLRRDALEAAWRDAPEGGWREHVTPFFYEQPERFRVLALRAPVDLGQVRMTVDTREDLDRARRVFEHFGERPFGWRDAAAELA